MNKGSQIVNVAVPINLNTLFKYYVPADTNADDAIYKRVLVNFHGRMIQGFAVSKTDFTDKYHIKTIKKIIDKDKIFTKKMVDFAEWIAEYYFAGIGEVLSLMIPKGKRPDKSPDAEEIKIKKSNLTPLQEKIYNNIKKDINENKKRIYLYGVTGSGKTEIYIKLIEDVLNEGKNCLFLVPEIALSYQTLNKLKSRFGNKCAALHSGLRSSVRMKEYLKLLNGEARIAVGPRSALFAPLDNIGIIIMDEENEGAYKSEESPRYHARTCAQYLANKNDSIIIFGSATPSIESWYYVKDGYLSLHQLKERYAGAKLPLIKIIDNNQNKLVRNLTLTLIDEVNNRLKKKEQVILLINRRGFANFIKCKNCGYVFQCKKCNLSFTYHKSKEKLICHHCGFSMDTPIKCTECNSEELMKIGAGTQRIEDEINNIFKHANIFRMDFDSLKKIKDLKDIFKKIEQGEIDIIIGTQMIAKGLHFPKIKFVGIINVDMTLNIPDYKASERTFALITQVAGRSGREGDRGEVMIQTFNPEHYSITCAKDNDFENFYNKEIKYRELLDMPPFNRMIRLIIRGKDEEIIKKDIENLSALLKKNNPDKIEILGPAPCLFIKINNNYRYHILLKSKKINLIQMLLKKNILNFKINNKNHLEIDVDPSSLV